jgi:DNA-binding response OmpR family regulator
VLETLLAFFALQEGVQVECAHSGDQALGQAIRASFDLVLLDLHLPGPGGLDILPVLRSSIPRAIIAIVSGYVDLVTEDDSHHADAVIPKPFSMKVLTELLRLTREIAERRDALRALSGM